MAQHLIEYFVENQVRKAPNKISSKTNKQGTIRKIQARSKLSAPKWANFLNALEKLYSAETIQSVLHDHDSNDRVA